jgi:hypothetical protein
MITIIKDRDTKYINVASYAMIEELSYETASTVIESWESLRRMENYAETTGRGLFIRFFREEPGAKAVFGFNKSGDDGDGDSVYDSQQFLAVGKNFIEIVDQAVDMLGPDLEVLVKVLIDLGEKYHNEYGMRPEYYSVLGRSLIDQLEEMLGPDVFSVHTKSCWLQVYGALAADMAAITMPEKTKTESSPPSKNDRASGSSNSNLCPKHRT